MEINESPGSVYGQLDPFTEGKCLGIAESFLAHPGPI
jgi:hypothetical protein